MAEHDATRSVPAVRDTALPVRADRPGQLAAHRAGALAIGALAIGQVAIGRSTIGELLLRRGRAKRAEVGSLVIQELIVGRLTVREFVRGSSPADRR